MKMRFGKLLVLVAGLSIVFSASAWAAGTPKIGFFSLQMVEKESRWGKRTVEEFKRQSESVKAEMDPKARAFKTAKDDFDKKKDVMDEKARTKKLKELQEMYTEAEKLAMEANERLNKLTTELRKPMIDKMLEIVRKIGKDDKYDFIFEQETAGLAFANEREDLTKRVVDELDRAMPKK